MEQLIEFLKSLPKGKVSDSDVRTLEHLLGYFWKDLSGSDTTNMRDYKLIGRMEEVVLEYPRLKFDIERHARTVNGSSRADIHTWIVDIEKKDASCLITGRYKQLRPRGKSLNVAPIAEEVANLILNHQEDPRLKWIKGGTVYINLDKFIFGVKWTYEGRCKRFMNKIDELLLPLGWRKMTKNSYSPPDTDIKSESSKSNK